MLRLVEGVDMDYLGSSNLGLALGSHPESLEGIVVDPRLKGVYKKLAIHLQP